MASVKFLNVTPDNIMSSGQQVDRIYSSGTLVWEKESTPTGSYIVLKTSSNSSSWSPSYVSNSGATLHWEVTGAATYSVDSNDPTFGFSAPGEKIITITSADDLTGLQWLDLSYNKLTSFDATGLTGLRLLGLNNNQLTSTAINSILDQLIVIGNTSGQTFNARFQTGGGCGDPAKIAALDAIWGTVLVDACAVEPTYPEVTIGTQTWMSVNLDIDDELGGIYAYDNNEANVATYGRLYTWDAAMRVAASIEGWHLPSDAEWTTLTDYLGGASVAGGKLKETGTTHWLSPNEGATNESGFTALPGGYRSPDGSFYRVGLNGFSWSATENDATNAWHRNLLTYGSNVSRGYNNKEFGHSVRLIKDYSHTPNITLVGDNPVTISVGDTYTDAGATAYDTRYGDITSDIVVVSNVNTSVAGTYTVTYNITTEDDYSAEEVVRTVVVEDTTIPVITVLGTDPVTITQGDIYVDAGATALDNYDGDITDNIITYNPVNVNVIGSYNITYNVQDSSGNNAIEKGRVVNVISAGTVFPEVTIGTQTWMLKNLDIDDGLGGIYAYDDNEANVATYGRLYTWDAAVRVAASIDGWHLPSDAEWTTLTDYLGGASVAGGKLREAGTEHWNSPNTGATNEVGFTGLPGGDRSRYGSFSSIGYYGYWWSATERDTSTAWTRFLSYDRSYLDKYYYHKANGYSVRLIRD